MRKKKIMKKLTPILIIWLFITLFTPILYAEQTIEITPEQPEPNSSVTFQVELPEENALNAYIWIQECNGNTGVCYKDRNITMTETSENTFEGTATLEHEEATYFQYTIKVNTENGWKEFFKETKVNLAEGTDEDNGNGNSGTDTPGFELFGLVISVIFILLILYRRKR